MMSVLALSFMTTLSAQKNNEAINKWSVGYGLGSHLWSSHPSTETSNLRNLAITHHELNGRYMFNNRIGIMLNVGYDAFRFGGIGDSDLKTHYISPTLQSVINIGDMMKLNTLHERFGLLLHTGVGYAAMWQKRGKVDNIASFVVGLTPQIRLTDHWSLKADVTFNANYSQQNTFDFREKIEQKSKYVYETARFFNLSVGVTYHIGKNEKHADWSPTDFGGGSKMKDLQAQIEQLELKQAEANEKIEENTANVEKIEEHLKDDDNDGVINSRDLDSNTPENAIVNSLGQEIKANTSGTGTGTVLADETEVAYFEVGKSTIRSQAFYNLNLIVAELKENPNTAITIEGHTDNTGSAALNQKLSLNRANALKQYLVNNGIDASRIETVGHGQTKPLHSNDTETGRAQNRRVVIVTK